MGITQKQLAHQLNVSQCTVSYAFDSDSKINELTRKRVLEAAAKLGYRPNAAARSMVSRRTRNIGVVIHSLGLGDGGGGHAYDTVSGINSVIEPAGYTTCLVQMADVEAGDEGMARVFREQALDGMIVHAAFLPHVREHLGRLVNRVIWCDVGVEEDELCIWRDEVEAGRLAGQAVVDAGYRQMLFVYVPPAGPRPYRHTQGREAGVRQALAAAGGTVHLGPVGSDLDCNDDVWLPRISPDVAVVACEYGLAEAVLFQAAARGLVAGHHFALASCDDRDWYRRRLDHLSRATFDRFDMGRQVAAMLLERIESPETPLPSSIVHPAWCSGETGRPGARPTLVPRQSLVERSY